MIEPASHLTNFIPILENQTASDTWYDEKSKKVYVNILTYVSSVVIQYHLFEFNLGEKSFRYGVNNVDTVAEKQSDINNVIKKFLNKDGEIADYKGYHKALYAADNVDSIAKHFYEQGKADAVKDIVAKSNNITTEPRQNATSLNLGGFKVKAVNGVDSSKLRIQKRF
jgi:uncharacterized protein (DUF111 family)